MVSDTHPRSSIPVRVQTRTGLRKMGFLVVVSTRADSEPTATVWTSRNTAVVAIRRTLVVPATTEPTATAI